MADPLVLSDVEREAVARAIYEEDHRGHFNRPGMRAGTWDEIAPDPRRPGSGQQDRYFRLADAALAVRVPVEGQPAPRQGQFLVEQVEARAIRLDQQIVKGDRVVKVTSVLPYLTQTGDPRICFNGTRPSLAHHDPVLRVVRGDSG